MGQKAATIAFHLSLDRVLPGCLGLSPLSFTMWSPSKSFSEVLFITKLTSELNKQPDLQIRSLDCFLSSYYLQGCVTRAKFANCSFFRFLN